MGQLITCWRCKRVLKIKSPLAAPSRYIHIEKGGKSLGERWGRALLPSITASWSLAGTPGRPLSGAARWVTIAGWVTLCIVVLLAVLMRTLGDRWLLATLLLFSGRWVYAVPVAALFLLALIARRAALVPLLLSMVVVLFGLMDFHTGWRGVFDAPTGLPIRVVTINAGGRVREPEELRRRLAGVGADIVAIQECGTRLSDALQSTGEWHTHHSPGLCLMSRFPIRTAEVMDRSALERSRRDVQSGIGGAGFVVRYVLETPAGPLGFTNLHLETVRKGLETLLDGFDIGRYRGNATIRAVEARRARDFVNGGVRPMIVAGDFNTPAEGRNLRDHWGDFTNAFARVGRGFGATKYNGWIRLRIDHVFYSAGVQATRALVGDDIGSDHRPLIVDVRVLERVTDR